MNTTFNLKRITLLLKRYFIENHQREILYWAIILITIAVFRNTPFVNLLLTFSGLYYAVRLTRELHSETQGTNYFMIPASITEKVTVLILLSFVYYFAVFLLMYIAGNLLGNFILPGESLNWSFLTTKNTGFSEIFGFSTSNNNGSFWQTIVNFASSQAMFLLGGIYFKKNAAAKTILVGCLFFMICIGLFFLIVPKSMFIEPCFFENMTYNFMDAFPYIKILKITNYISIPFFWFLNYIRLNEKEI